MKTKTLLGITFKIDRPKGYIKVWKNKDGSEKTFVYPVDYGFFPGIKGEDGEGLDAFVGDDIDGNIEAFQKLKKDDNGNMVLDETKFIIGVNDRDREKIYKLYGNEVWHRRIFHDVNSLMRVVSKFKGAKKDRYKQAEFHPEVNYWEDLYRGSSERPTATAEASALKGRLVDAFKGHDNQPKVTGNESGFGGFFQEGVLR